MMSMPPKTKKSRDHSTVDLVTAFVVAIVMVPAVWALGTFVLMTTWNWFIPDITGWKPLTFWAAAGVAAVKGLLFLHAATDKKEGVEVTSTATVHCFSVVFTEVGVLISLLFLAGVAHHFLVA